jgi:hypothetical protein
MLSFIENVTSGNVANPGLLSQPHRQKNCAEILGLQNGVCGKS